MTAIAREISVATVVGSGITLENLGNYHDADALIVGSSIKRDGVWSSLIDADRAAALVRAFRGLPVHA